MKVLLIIAFGIVSPLNSEEPPVFDPPLEPFTAVVRAEYKYFGSVKACEQHADHYKVKIAKAAGGDPESVQHECRIEP